MHHASQLGLQKQAERQHERAEELAHQQKRIEQRHAETEHETWLRRNFMQEQEQVDQGGHARQLLEYSKAEDIDAARSRRRVSEMQTQRGLLEYQRSVIPLLLTSGRESPD